MTKKISKKNRNKITKKSLKLRGGKPLFRNITQVNINTDNTLRTAFGFNGGPVFITSITLIAGPSFYNYFYLLNLNNNNNNFITNINVDNNPVHSNPNNIVVKMCLISNHEIMYGNQSTRTSVDFRNECQIQYNIFTSSCLPGANSLTPGIVHAEILNNDVSINTLQNFRNITAGNNNDANAINTFNLLINTLQANNTWRLAIVYMEYFPNSINLLSAIQQVLNNNFQQLCLRNMYRWALLRCAHVSGIFHRDFHLGNALYSQMNAPGFFHDQDPNGQLVPVNESIQIIDWSYTFNDQPLSNAVRQLFNDMRLHIQNAANANQFTQNLNNSNNIGRGDPNYAILNAQIHNIFTNWLNLGNINLPPYQWVTSNLPNEEIDSHMIMYYENRYLLGRRLVNANTYGTVIQPPDLNIMNTLLNLN
jgi:hypothetical protein